MEEWRRGGATEQEEVLAIEAKVPSVERTGPVSGMWAGLPLERDQIIDRKDDIDTAFLKEEVTPDRLKGIISGTVKRHYNATGVMSGTVGFEQRIYLGLEGMRNVNVENPYLQDILGALRQSSGIEGVRLSFEEEGEDKRWPPIYMVLEGTINLGPDDPQIESSIEDCDVSSGRKHKYVSELEANIARIKQHAGGVEGFEFKPEQLDELVSALEERLSQGNVIVSRHDFVMANRKLDSVGDLLKREAEAKKKDPEAPEELKVLLSAAVVALKKGVGAMDMADLNVRAAGRRALRQQLGLAPYPDVVK